MTIGITADKAMDLFCSGGEFAVLDVREQEEFSRSHMLLASCTPLSRLELMVADLVPCRTVPVILVDEGDEAEPGRAMRAASVLKTMGYTDTRILTGGMIGWKAAGRVDFTGVGALSKGFGEYVEENLETPRLEPAEIKCLMDSGEPYVVIDVRPREEYRNMNIPGSVNAPGCEVLYRLADLAPDPEINVIINCAGRTRSIIGTQTLRNAGIPNRVVALKGGTMNWQLAGFPLEYGAPRRSAPPSVDALGLARQRALDVARKAGVTRIGRDELELWKSEIDRTLYIFDVRQPEEFAAGHLPGSINAPGGQLVQATDEYAAVRNARFVLVDDTEVRAIMTAHWLIQMGLDQVYILDGGLGGSGYGISGLERGPRVPSLPVLPDIARMAPADLDQVDRQATACLVVNVGSSKIHRQGHVPGAAWVTRGYLANARDAVPGARLVVVTADEEAHALLTASDAKALWPEAEVLVLDGGVGGWVQAGLGLETGMPLAYCAEDDVWYKPYTDIHAKPEAMQDYFAWEFGLVERIRSDGSVRFRLMEGDAVTADR